MTDVATTVSAAVASLVVAGLGVYAYTQLGASKDTRGEHDTKTEDKGEGRKARRRRKGKDEVGEGHGRGDDAGGPDVPGGFEGAMTRADAGADATRDASPQPPSAVHAKKKKKGKQAGEEARVDAGAPRAGSTKVTAQRTQDGTRTDGDAEALLGSSDLSGAQKAEDDAEVAHPDAARDAPPGLSQSTGSKGRKRKGKPAGDEDEERSETRKAAKTDGAREAPLSTSAKAKKKKTKKAGDKDEETSREAGRAAAGDSTDADASVSLPPSASGSTRAHGVAGAPSQPPNRGAPRQTLRSLSFDTDGSWTHVDRRRANKPGGQASMEVTSSDLASTESSSPVAERVECAASDIRGTRGDLEKQTLAEKLVPRPGVTGVDDMLEQPTFPTLARVMRVQPRADEAPVPGFSWEDYGDVVEDSVLVHDADEEDEGEWGIVKSRNRTRSTQTPATATASQAAVAPETMTKKQRQNARKRELAKAVRTDAEAVRLEGLAKHKRELERLRIIEQSRQGGGRQPSGGMHATVDDRGKLVWE